MKLNNVNCIAQKATKFPFRLLYNTNQVYFHPKTNVQPTQRLSDKCEIFLLPLF